MPPEGMDRRTYLEQKFGGKDGAEQVYGSIVKAAKGDGLDLNIDAIKRTPNTIDAHRFIHWAGIEGMQNEAVAALFVANFEKGQDISDHAVLANIAESVGMERAVVERLLASDAEVAETRALDESARKMGVSGVPTFLIDGQYVVSGAQETAHWVEIIDEINAIKAKAE